MTDFVVKEMEGSFGGSHEWCLIRQAILTWQDSDVRGRYKQFFSQRIYMKIEFSSQRREMLLFLTTNMVAVTGVTCKVAILDLYLITAPQGWVVQNWVEMTQVQCEIWIQIWKLIHFFLHIICQLDAPKREEKIIDVFLRPPRQLQREALISFKHCSRLLTTDSTTGLHFIRSLTTCVAGGSNSRRKKRGARGRHATHDTPPSRVSPAHPILFCTYFFQASATQA